jgi:tetratricopeptide (TPR) repeat protein
MLRNKKQPSRRKKVQADPTPAAAPPAPGESHADPVSSMGPGQQSVASGDELFASPIRQQPDCGDIFASFLDLASRPSEAPEIMPPPSPPTGGDGSNPSGRKLSYVQQILIIGIVATAAITVYVTVQPIMARLQTPKEAPSESATDRLASTPSPAERETPVAPEPNTTSAKAEPGSVPAVEALSLGVADKLYLAGDSENALVTYDRLLRRLPPSEEHQAMRDFLTFRMAMCYRNAGNNAQADAAFRTLSLSRPSILRALARYHQCLALMERGRYLEASSRAYQCLALIEVVDYDKKWVRAVQQQCTFLVAEAFTRHLLSLRDADADLPATLWTRHPNVDPFLSLEEPQVKVLLTAGTERMNEALLSPQIQSAVDAGRWTVACNGASIEELLARFASNARLNIQWLDASTGSLGEETVRRRPVYLYMASATAEQIFTTSAGSVGLMAQMDGQDNVPIRDPSAYTSLTDHMTLLINESLSLWNRFLLTAEDDKRLANAHFAIGLLHALQDRQDEAAAEYRLVATRFPKDSLAPHALLYSGKLKLALRDYPGAQKDLRELADLYPDISLSDRALLYLADASMRVGAHNDAIDLFRKVYNLGLSAESQTESALGAGRSLYEVGSYEEAAKWLSRYIDLAKGQNRREFHATCLLLGKTYLELRRPQQAHVVLKLAMQGDLSRPQHVETVETLVKAYMQQGLMVEALGVLETTYTWQLSPEENMELLLLRAQVLRSIGLTDKAITTLKDRGQFLTNMELKARIALELTSCYVERGQHDQARTTLSGVLPSLPPGPMANQVGRELARVCLRMGEGDQAVSICTQLLRTADAQEKEKLLAILSEAHRKQNDYSGAMSVLLDSPDAAASDPNNGNQGK